MTLELIPSIEVALVAHFKAQPDVAALVSGRVSTKLPEDRPGDPVVMPWIVLTRDGGAPADGDAPVDIATIGIIVYAASGDTFDDPDWPTADLVGRTVVAAARGVDQLVVGDATVYGIGVFNHGRLSEDGNGRARYLVNLAATLRSSS